MGGEFVALADLLRAPAASAAARDERVAHELPASLAHVPPDAVADGDVAAAVREARLFRARLADAFDDAAARLMRDLAADVLARELRLAPCDLTAIVQRIAERAPVVRVRVAACDVARGVRLPRGCDAAIVEDPALARGDAIVELAGGALDARLGVRLALVLEAFA
ncbi:MAG TPA: hypothetical protein VGU66_21620 [Candidatus Elarobacter sp.]|nr:hypothetical protein [Candidatus Elarobacter sp.]